ncbi:angiopoietin-related protein 1 [Elysia marginata]|uniref:Angiopoietin-related protein 1 n=1 Tax=Elysia marginata TaxID=1093978 RepID=A0AAV4HH50_9GAST|nr:angiopoietin-related protein 1 [Elysia marginata]
MDHNAVYVVFYMCLVSACTSLELRLAQDTSSLMRGPRAVCGVLTCDDIINSSISDRVDNRDVSHVISFDKILSMSLYKKASTRFTAGTTNKRDVLVASVTPQEPSLIRVANGVKVVGSLDTGRATVRVELVKREDCQSEFTCHVRGLDSQGKEAMSTASLVQQPCHSENQVDRGKGMPSLSLQLLTSIQQLVTHSVAGLEDKIEQIKKDFSDQITSLEKNVNGRTDTLENNLNDQMGQLLKDFGDKSDTFENRIDNKLDLLENRMEDKIDNNNNLNKLIQLDVKVSTYLDQFRSQAKTDIIDTLENLKQEMQQEQRLALRNVSGKVEETVNKTSGLLASLKSEFDLIKLNDQINLLTFRNETGRIYNALVSEDNVCRRMMNETVSLNTEMLVNFKELKSNAQNWTTETQSNFRDSLSGLEQIMSKAMANALIPSSCTKGMRPSLSPNFLYPMTYSKHGLNVSFLCDTITDNGGWIIIQRRVTGTINFNRNWADYRQGFGLVVEDYWLGNDNIHTITSSGTYELRVEVQYKGRKAFAHYASFSIADESDNYRLRIGAYDGTAGDSLAYHNGHEFSTVDRDNDKGNTVNCAEIHGGGWWFAHCDKSNLNGNWGIEDDTGVEWHAFTSSDTASYSEMKIRRV